MSIQIIDEPRGFAAAFGQQLGKGIGEQLPKTMERYGVAKSLQELEKMGSLPAGSARLAARGGAELAKEYIPFLRRSQYEQELKKQALPTTQAKQEAPSTMRPALSSEAVSTEKPMKDSFGFKWKSPEQIQKFQRTFEKPIGSDVRQKEIEVIRDPAYAHITDPREVRNIARDLLERDKEAQREWSRDYKESAKQDLSTIFQDPDLQSYTSLSGEMLNELLRQGESLREEGLNPQEAKLLTTEAAKRMKTAMLNIRESSAKIGEQKDKINTLLSNREDFEDTPFIKAFDDAAISMLNISPAIYGNILHPVDREDQMKIIRSARVAPIWSPKKREEKMTQLALSIKPGDDINAIQYELLKNKIKPSIFKKAIDKEVSRGNLILDDKQKAQNKKSVSDKFGYGDLFFEATR